MAFLRTIVICLISAVLTVVMNLLGLGFTDPVEFSYEVRAKYSTDTRVYSLGSTRGSVLRISFPAPMISKRS